MLKNALVGVQVLILPNLCVYNQLDFVTFLILLFYKTNPTHLYTNLKILPEIKTFCLWSTNIFQWY